MKITPLDIRQRTFKKTTFGGIDREEVATYLEQLSGAWEDGLDENRELAARLSNSERELAKMREVETSLYRALKTAEDTGNTMMEQARQQSALQLRESELKSETLLKEARWQAKNIIEEARQEARKTFNKLQQELDGLEEETRSMERYRDNLLSELRGLAADVVEKVERQQQRARTVNFNRPVTQHEPDFAVSFELDQALRDTDLSTPAEALPAPLLSLDSEPQPEKPNFFDGALG
jgi:cell division initiation protein